MGNIITSKSGEEYEIFNEDTSSRVKEKLLFCSSGFNKKIDQLNTLTDILSNEKLLKKTFLSNDWSITKDLWIDSKEVLSKETNTQNFIESVELERKEFESFIKFMSQVKSSKEVKVKLIILEKPLLNYQPICDIMSPILRSIPIQQEIDCFHIGIFLQPWLFELNIGSLCIPRKVVNIELLRMWKDFPHWSVIHLDKAIDEVSKIIVKWNTALTKEVSKNSLRIERNLFIIEMLNVLNVNLDLRVLEEFLNDIQIQGKSSLKLNISDSFRKDFDLESEMKIIKFETHEQLDIFSKRIMKHRNGSCMFMEYITERNLLQIYDRVFWFKYMKYPNDSRWKPHHERCLFWDPLKY